MSNEKLSLLITKLTDEIYQLDKSTTRLGSILKTDGALVRNKFHENKDSITETSLNELRSLLKKNMDHINDTKKLTESVRLAMRSVAHAMMAKEITDEEAFALTEKLKGNNETIKNLDKQLQRGNNLLSSIIDKKEKQIDNVVSGLMSGKTKLFYQAKSVAKAGWEGVCNATNACGRGILFALRPFKYAFNSFNNWRKDRAAKSTILKKLSINIDGTKSEFENRKKERLITINQKAALLKIQEHTIKVNKKMADDIAKLDQHQEIAIRRVPLLITQEFFKTMSAEAYGAHKASDKGNTEILLKIETDVKKIKENFSYLRNKITENNTEALNRLKEDLKRIQNPTTKRSNSPEEMREVKNEQHQFKERATVHTDPANSGDDDKGVGEEFFTNLERQ